jgi:type II secretory pathway predicted ATPase ExeA/cell division protein FtsN
VSQPFSNAPFESPEGTPAGSASTGPALRPQAGADAPPASPTLTYEPYYGLREKAFSLSADPRFLFRSPAHAPAFEDLLTGIRRREGLIVLTGEIGTGKSTLIRSVLQHLDRRTFTALVPDPFVSREDLLKMLLVDFGVVSIADLKRGSLAGASRPDLSYPLYEFLDSLVPLQAFAVLIIDEAQNLPLHLLEEIRILSDLEHRERLLQVVLVGQPELRTNLKLPQMRQVDQRVSVRCELSPLDRRGVAGYVRHRLDVASGGRARALFSDAALDAIYERSGGVPRVVNLICDRALQRGHATGAATINLILVLDAVERLGLERTTPEGPAPAPGSVAGPAPAAPDRADAADRGPRVQAHSVPIAPASRPSPQSLSEFTTETELSPGAASVFSQVAQPRRTGSAWSLGASVLGIALVVAASTALWLAYTAAGAAPDVAMLPPPAAWTRAEAPADGATTRAQAAQAGATGTPAAGPPYAIQVASFANADRAERSITELALAGFAARIVPIDPAGTGQRWLLVRVDGQGSPEDADRTLAGIRAMPGYGDAVLLPD